MLIKYTLQELKALRAKYNNLSLNAKIKLKKETEKFMREYEDRNNMKFGTSTHKQKREYARTHGFYKTAL